MATEVFLATYICREAESGEGQREGKADETEESEEIEGEEASHLGVFHDIEDEASVDIGEGGDVSEGTDGNRVSPFRK
jgi:hypothetical protein